ncbi:phosphatase PAP2 family protein [Actinopolymorpha sp. NPDC004070]|uniref:phosphatase PAP2 family protein n=1 Tax=Actinopolymorpha sp. NPDC004070 TaxID=3154548 RepID=UPI0033B7CEFE
MRSLVRGLLSTWLLTLAVAQTAALALVWWIFVRTPHGQVVDATVLRGTRFGRASVEQLVSGVLDAVSLASLVAATVVLGFIALARRRVLLAVAATVLVAGANLTTQILKDYVISRPDLGIPGTNIGAPNSLPSGHMTVAASVAVAAVMVVPARLRATVAVLGACYATLTGIATLSAGWHRPSDALAALLIVGAWASVVAAGLVLAQRSRTTGAPSDPHPRMVGGLALVGGAALVGAVLLVALADQGSLTPPVEVGRSRLVLAYAGGAIGVGGASCLAMAVVLATVHRVVPRLAEPVVAAEQTVPAGRVGPEAEPAAADNPGQVEQEDRADRAASPEREAGAVGS